MSRKSIDEQIEWPIKVMKKRLQDNPNFTGDINTRFLTGGPIKVNVLEEEPKPKGKAKNEA